MSDMMGIPAGGPQPPGPAQDPGQVNGAAPAEQPGPSGPDLRELAVGIAAAAQTMATKLAASDDPNMIKACGGAILECCQGLAAVAPPMKPIDPQLHASFRQVDPQKALQMRHEAELQRLKQEHDVHMAEVKAAADQHRAEQQPPQQPGQQQPRNQSSG